MLPLPAGEKLVLLDVGAAGGLVPHWDRHRSQLRAILCEPDPRSFEQLQRTVPPDWIVLPVALWDRAGMVELKLSRKPEASSLFEPNMELLRRFPDPERFEVVDRRMLPTDTMANQLSKLGGIKVDFVKIDAHGAELGIVQHAGPSLDGVIGMEVEVALAQLWIGQPRFSELFDYLVDRGFELMDLRRYFWKRDNEDGHSTRSRGQLIFGDALFFRAPESFLDNPNTTPALIRRVMSIYLIYGYSDLASAMLSYQQIAELFSTEELNDLRRIILDFSDRGPPDFRGKSRLWLVANRLLSMHGFSSQNDASVGNAA